MGGGSKSGMKRGSPLTMANRGSPLTMPTRGSPLTIPTGSPLTMPTYTFVSYLADTRRKWTMEFNVAKCKAMHTGNKNNKFSYEMKVLRRVFPPQVKSSSL